MNPSIRVSGRRSKFTPVFEVSSVRASVTGIDGNIVTVKFNKRRKGQRINAAAAAAKQARLV